MILTLIILSLAVTAVSITVSRAKVTNGLRELALRRTPPLGRLLSCPYCVSHWAALAAVIVCRVEFFPDSGLIVNMIVGTFAIVGGAALTTGASMQLLHIQESVIERLRDELDAANN